MPAPMQPFAHRKLVAATLLALTLAWGVAPAYATPFTIVGPVTTAQTLGTASGETGSIATGGTLTLGKSTVAVTISGNNAVLDNQGTIAQIGTGRAIRDNTGVTNLTVNNGSSTNKNAVIRTADADVIQMNVPAASVVLNNYGTMESKNASAGGAQAVDFSAMTAANVVNNYAGGLLVASEADAVRPGANGVVNNAGTIRSTTATGSSSDGIDGQSNSGIRVVNAATGVVDGARHGITAGQDEAGSAFTLDVSNAAGGIIRGNNGSGLNIDGVNAGQVVTVVNHGTISGNGVTGDGDGIDVDALVNITNTGTIRSVNAFSNPADGMAYSEGISAGGGTIVNAGTIEGLVAAGNTNAVGRGITLAGNDMTGGLREGLYGNAKVVNQAGGTIRGQGDSAIVGSGEASGFTIAIDNNAGAVILGGGASSAAIVTKADNTVIHNAGLIDGSSSGKALQLGAGINALFIDGGKARVIGDIDGGSGGKNTMTVAAGAGNTFSYAGAIAHFASIELKDGTFALEGKAAIDPATALILSGGTLDVGGLADQELNFASLVLTGDSAIDFGGSTLVFNGLDDIAGGAHLALTGLGDALDTVLRFQGDLTGNAGFQALMASLSAGGRGLSFSFDGSYTNIDVAAAQVPEPGSIALVLGGIGMMGVLARRRKRSA
jgi:hypothetical protein